MTDLNSDIEEVIKNLKLSEKKSLNNIYLQLIDEKDENTFINLDTGEITKDLSHNNYGLIIKMSIQTFNELKNNEIVKMVSKNLQIKKGGISFKLEKLLKTESFIYIIILIAISLLLILITNLVFRKK